MADTSGTIRTSKITYNNPQAEILTNQDKNSCHVLQCDCETVWSLAQDFCINRLQITVGDMRSVGKSLVEIRARAKRIAATYARFYLEQEQYGDPTKKGRYYWTAIAAFASKTVFCGMDHFLVQTGVSSDRVLRNISEGLADSISKAAPDGLEGLAKGNFWLFMDVGGWHWFYNYDAASWDQCIASRNTQKQVHMISTKIQQLPWNKEALPKINFLQKTNYLEKGFQKLKEVEDLLKRNKPQDAQKPQFEHLMQIANHEQEMILQKLIYTDPAFVKSLEVGRGFFGRHFGPPLQLVFSNACDVDDPNLKSVAPEGIKLEDLRQRMDWIRDAAKQFHGLMINQTKYMESQLQTIAAWVGQT